MTLPSSRPSRSGSAAAMTEGDAVVSVPNDLIFDILSRLPIKSVCRFRCLSRGWNAIISGLNFLALHKSRSEPLLITCHDMVVQLVDMDGNILRALNVDPFLRNLPSTDGLVFTMDNWFRDAAQLMDLATGKVVVLTCLKPVTTGNMVLGFGPAAPSRVHKVVCIGPESWEILTLEDGARWRMMQWPPIRVNQYCIPVVIDGILYVLASSEHIINQNPDIVICFDLESEEWNKVVKCPPKVERQLYLDNICELSGTLCLVQSEVLIDDHGRYTNVWLLTDSDKSIWDKAYTIPMDPPSKYLPMPLRMMHAGKLLVYSSYNQTRTPILKVYDPLDGTFKKAVKTLDQHCGSFHLCNLGLEHIGFARK